MAIKQVKSELSDYAVGVDGVVSIELTARGNDTTTIYLIKYDNREPLYLGLLEHDVEYMERVEEQTTIFDFL